MLNGFSRFLKLGLIAATMATPPGALLAAEESPQITLEGQQTQPDAFTGFTGAFPNGVSVLPSVTYWSPLGFRPLDMDLYLPPKDGAKPAAGYPVVVFIHGGGWVAGNARKLSPIANFPEVLSGIAARGYVVAAVNYRFSAEAKWPAQGQDIKAAIRFLRAMAKTYGIDPGRFATWGVSAGGQLSAVAAASCGLPALQPHSQSLPKLPESGQPVQGTQYTSNGDCVQAAVAWYGVYDMTTLSEQADDIGAMSRDVDGAPEWRLLGCRDEECPADTLRNASAGLMLSPSMPPVLLIAGTRDKVVPSAQTAEFADALVAADLPHEAHLYDDTGHNLVASDRKVTVQVLNAALDQTLDFLDRELAVAP